MKIESTNDNTPTTPAITYSECYVQPFFSFYNADNMAIMKTFKDKEFDLAIVDPPYGLNIAKNGTLNTSSKTINVYKKGNWDTIKPTQEYFNELFRISKNQIVWGGNYSPELWINGCRGFIYWDKMNHTDNRADGELAWTSFDICSLSFKYMWDGNRYGYEGNIKGVGKPTIRIHVTEKPVALYEWILTKFCKNDFKILDTHLGSGSIAIAIDKANTLDKKNLTFVGIELDPDYFRAAVERFKNHKRQCVLF